jgi:hypothetical protein
MGSDDPEAADSTTPASSTSWRSALPILAAAGSLAGAVAAISQILDYAESNRAALWTAVGVIMMTAPAVLTAGALVMKRKWRLLSVASIALLLMTAGAFVVAQQMQYFPDAVCPVEDRDDASGRYAYPRDLTGGTQDLQYCRVDVNEGRPLSRHYTLSGRIIGRLPEGRTVALVLQADPGSCDTKGQPGNGNYYLMQEIPFTEQGATWDLAHEMSYPEAITLKHNFYYVSMPRENLEDLRTARQHEPHGLPRLPEPSDSLAVFSIQGKDPAAEPC